MGYWTGIRNDYFENDIDVLQGDTLASVSIDAWKTADDNEEGKVIACVLLSKSGDVLVDYHDNVARVDTEAQQAIKEAMGRLKEYYRENFAIDVTVERDELSRLFADNFTPEEYDPSDFEWCALPLQLAGYGKKLGFVKEVAHSLVSDELGGESLEEKLALSIDGCSNIHVFRAKDVTPGGYPDGLSYWSNCMGELHEPLGCETSEDELPAELRRVYSEIAPFEQYGSRCCLVETRKGFGIALENEYDEGFAVDVHASMDELFLYAVKDAGTIAKDPMFQNAEIFVEEHSGVSDSHELIVVVPASISREEFDKIAKGLDSLVYQSAYQLESGVLDDLVRNAEKQKSVSNGALQKNNEMLR